MKLSWQAERPEQFTFETPLVPGVFIERPNRFVAMVDIDGQRHRVHVPDPGRLKELLIPGVKIYLADYGENTTRKTRFSLQLVESPDKRLWVSLNTQLPNQVIKILLSNRALRPFQAYNLVRSEFTYGESRIDFLLQHRKTKQNCLLEVKSVTLVNDSGLALFPDAPTARGARHIRELIMAKAKKEYDALVLFVVQRADAKAICPNQETDPEFAMAVADAMAAGLAFHGLAYDITPTGITLKTEELPVLLPGQNKAISVLAL